jgi:hypothetical protein
LSTRSIVKKNRCIPQTSQDKAVATNYHSRQTSWKNQNLENFNVFFGAGFIENFKVVFGFFRRFKLKGKTREEFCPTPFPCGTEFWRKEWTSGNA